MNLTCLTIYPPIPPVPKTANDSNTFNDPTYNPSSGGIAQMISTSILRSTFSTNDIHSFINNVLNRFADSWTVSEITKTKPIPSIIIYACVTLVLFLIFSISFCVISCGNSKKYRVSNCLISIRFLLIFLFEEIRKETIENNSSLCLSISFCLSCGYR